MAEHDWKQLLDDPEVERIIEVIHGLVPLNHDPYLDDDRISYLWDTAVEIAMRYKLDENADDPLTYWRGYLWTALRRAAQYQRTRVYGPFGDAKRDAEHQRLSIDGIIDPELGTGDQTLAPTIRDPEYYDDALDVTFPEDWHWPDAPGAHRIARSDPMYQILLIERLERVASHRDSGVYIVETPVHATTGLCTDPSCWEPIYRSELCSLHYRRWRDRWGHDGAQECKADDCDRPGTAARGYCGKHYAAWRRSNPDAPRCLDCDRAAVRNGRCTYHGKIEAERGTAA